MRPWLNWIEQQSSNLWVAGSSPAGRATKIKSGLSRFFVAKKFFDKSLDKCKMLSIIIAT